ncbi:hypothetical protein QBC47DRAFT_366597 [Echria macrotheca]|uniref:Uncharacterized protein n=1 Tax=Echria macrotheca TaxID=438768 RepID=A0AAJ0BNN8_9PEZI|nr:hypothetical protein QBC47DRAFT_366597 [Echria macrotheca]
MGMPPAFSMFLLIVTVCFTGFPERRERMAPFSARKPLWAWRSLVTLACFVLTGMAQTSIESFRGYSLTLGPTLSSSAVFCGSDERWSTAGTMAACCTPGLICDYITACNAGTMSYLDGSTAFCGSNFANCGRDIVIDKFPIPTSTWTNIYCVPDGAGGAGTLYREIITSTPTPTPTPSPSLNPTSTTQPPPPPPSSTDAPPSSQAWIAGPVIGGIVAAVGAVLFAFWLGRRWGNKKKTNLSPEQAAFTQTFRYQANKDSSLLGAPSSQWDHTSWKSGHGMAHQTELPG